MTDAGRRAALDAIAAEVAVCTRCRLHTSRTRAVPGEGSEDTEVVFVGEGPGFNEDRQGRPFVGRAGALLTELLGSVHWSRDEVFITNVVKCRPPDNRDPEADEIAACAPYLARQLAVLEPALVVTLGRFSMARFMPGARIGGVHGTYRPADPSAGAAGALAYAMYHPAAALRQDALKETLFADMQGVPAALLAARERRAPAGAAAGEPAGEEAAAQAELSLAPGDVVAPDEAEAPGDAAPAGVTAAPAGVTAVDAPAPAEEPAPSEPEPHATPEPPAIEPAGPMSHLAAPAGDEAPAAGRPALQIAPVAAPSGEPSGRPSETMVGAGTVPGSTTASTIAASDADGDPLAQLTLF